MVAPNGFGSKKSRKNDQNFPNFFFRKKKNIKQVRKPSFIKNVQKLPILAISLQDMKNLLCQKMGLTVAYIYDMTPRGTFSRFLD